MCEKCFQKEIVSFSSEKEWIDFDWELTKKLGSNKMKSFEFIVDRNVENHLIDYIYECCFCHQKWKLQDPDLSIRGYFLKIR